jgi:glutamate dehydrogenase
LAYSKLVLYDKIIQSNLPDSPYFSGDLQRYFPNEMCKTFGDEINAHPLKREITATIVTNSIVNRMGITFVHRTAENTGMSEAEVAMAYTVARDAFDLRQIWSDIEALDGKIPAELQVEMFKETYLFVENITLWLLRNIAQPMKIDDVMAAYEKGIKAYRKCYQDLMSNTIRKAYRGKLDHYMKQGIKETLATRIANLEALYSALDVVTVANASKLPVDMVGKIYFQVGANFCLGWLRHYAARAIVESHWDRLAIHSIHHELYDQQRRLTNSAIHEICEGDSCEATIDRWREKYKEDIARYTRFIEDLRSSENIQFSTLIIAQQQVEAVAAEH